MAIDNRFGGKVVHVENLDKVMATLTKFQREDMAKATARAFSRTAKKGVIAGKRELRRGLTTRSNYITNGVKGQPITHGQQVAFAKSFEKNFIADGSVYIRGATSKSRELDFLMDHEDGTNRTAVSKFMAVPLKGLRDWKGGKDYRTNRGRTKSRLKPGAILGDDKNKQMSKAKDGKSYIVVYSNKTQGKRRGGRGRKRNKKPFVMTRGNGARVKSQSRYQGKLLYLYKFQKTTKQNEKIHFGDSVEMSIKSNMRRDLIRQIRPIIPNTSP